MRWKNIQEATPQARIMANAVFNQAYASKVVPPDSKKMLYIDVHTEASGASSDEEGPVYRLFPNGVIDVGLPGLPDPEPKEQGGSVEYFVTMTVDHHVGIGKVEKRRFAEKLTAGTGDTMENLYWRAWAALAKEHRFTSDNAQVRGWSANVNELPPPPR